jgi:DNA polymerase-3 subunit beta
VSKTVFAVSSDELRPAMTGVNIVVDPKASNITMAATDAHKLSEIKISGLAIQGEDVDIIVPKKPLSMLKNVLDKEETVVSITEKSIKFNDGVTTVLTKLNEAKFPPYSAVIPTGSPYEVVLDKHETVSSLKRVGLFANKTSNMVKFSFKETQVEISGMDTDLGKECNEVLQIQSKGFELDIAFNYRFLLDVINACDSNEFVMKLSNQSRAVILTPSEQTEGFNQLLLIMPVLIA